VKRAIGALLVVALVCFSLGPLRTPIPVSAAPTLSVTAKKVCKTVVKKVHGKKKKVRVCKTVKPKPAVPPAPAAHVLATIPVAHSFQMAGGFGSVWVNRGPTMEDRVSRIDPGTNSISAIVTVNNLGGQGIASGFGSIWEVDIAHSVSRIDPTSNTVIATIPIAGTSPIGIAVSDHAVWVATHNEPAVANGATVVKIDPATNAVVDTISVGGSHGGPAALLSAAGSIWAYDQVNSQVARIDPSTDKVTDIPTSRGCVCRSFAADAAHVWMSIPETMEVDRIDPATNAISTAVPKSALTPYKMSGIYWLEAGGGALWLSGPCGKWACVVKIDPATNTVTKGWSVTVDGSPGDAGLALLYAGDSLWLSEVNRVLRLDVNS
jgi:YVTN family beta-propeller protein